MLRITGDINLTDNAFDVGYGVGSLIAKGFDPFIYITKEDEDIWIGNFEGVISDVSELKNYAKDCFRIKSDSLQFCSKLIDYYGIANNHVMEHGSDAYKQMVSNLIPICKGIFGSLQNQSVTFKHQRKNVSISGFSLRYDQTGFKPLYWNFPEYKDVEEEYNKISSAEYKIIYIHWGVEFVDHPNVDQIRFAHWLIDLGYDMVIGMHPHILQGYEIYKGKYIFYSLGNFVFNMAWEPTKYGAIVNIDLESGNVEYNYIKIDKSYCPSIIVKEEVPENYRFENLNKKIPCLDNLEQYMAKANQGLKEYRKSNYKEIIKNLYKYDHNVFLQIFKNFLERKLHI